MPYIEPPNFGECPRCGNCPFHFVIEDEPPEYKDGYYCRKYDADCSRWATTKNSICDSHPQLQRKEDD